MSLFQLISLKTPPEKALLQLLDVTENRVLRAAMMSLWRRLAECGALGTFHSTGSITLSVMGSSELRHSDVFGES